MANNYVTNPRRSGAEQTKRDLWAVAVLTLLTGAVCLSAGMILVAINPGDPTVLPAVTVTPAQAARATPRPTPAPSSLTYAKLTAREWLKIAKQPDSHAGETYVVHGVVTQFDAATGRSTFRANVDGVKHDLAYDYPTNVIMSSRGGADLDDLVEDDQFTARVQVLGGYTYATQLGGQTTAPELTVHRLTRR